MIYANLRQRFLFFAALFIVVTGFLYAPDLTAREKMIIADFENEQLKQWETKSFQGKTRYEIIQLNGKKVLQAVSNNSASGLAKPLRIDLKQTPFLNWSWKIDRRLEHLDETKKSGDDYAARVYVIIDGGWKFWNTLAVNYVWSGNQSRGAQWNNAFAGSNARMIAVKGKEDSLEWHQEKRNVYQDLITAFGDKGSAEANEEAYRYIDAVAVMTDTDNSGASVTAWYGDIYFSQK